MRTVRPSFPDGTCSLGFARVIHSSRVARKLWRMICSLAERHGYAPKELADIDVFEFKP